MSQASSIRALVECCLAADVVVLPSRMAGEPWGLVVNEAMQTCCALVVAEAVGCAADFGGWECFRTTPVVSASHQATVLVDLSRYPLSFTSASARLQGYSIDAAAQAFRGAVRELR
jgi:glycosyltransferase involved in cell wall biosynthesis